MEEQRFIAIGHNDDGVKRYGAQGKRRGQMIGPPSATVYDMAYCGREVAHYSRLNGGNVKNPLGEAEEHASMLNHRDSLFVQFEEDIS